MAVSLIRRISLRLWACHLRRRFRRLANSKKLVPIQANNFYPYDCCEFDEKSTEKMFSEYEELQDFDKVLLAECRKKLYPEGHPYWAGRFLEEQLATIKEESMDDSVLDN